jgi:hypothetical protein
LVRLLADLAQEVDYGWPRGDRERVERLFRDYVMVVFAFYASVDPMFWKLETSDG